VEFSRFRQFLVWPGMLGWGSVALGAIALVEVGPQLVQAPSINLSLLRLGLVLGLMLLGLALAWWRSPSPAASPWRSRSELCALGGLGLGLGMLCFALLTLPSGGLEFPWSLAIGVVNLLVLGIALLGLNQGHWYGRAQGLALLAFLLSLLVLMGYFYQVPNFYRSGQEVFTLLAIAACLGLAAGVWAVGPDQGWVQVLTSPYAGGKAARRLLPVILGVPLVFGGISVYVYAWPIHPLANDVWVLGRSVLNILILGGTTWWIARSLNDSDRQRRCSECDLRALNTTLNERVLQRTAELTAINRQMEENYQLLVTVINGISDPIFVKDRQGRLVLVNEATATKFARSVEGLIGCTDFDLHEPEIAAALSTQDFALMAQAQTRTLEEQVPYGGQMRTYLTTKSPWRDRDGNVIGLIAVAKDISDRKRTELALQTSERRLRAIIDSEPECVKITTATGELLDMNAAGLAMIEADSLEQVRGCQIANLATDADRAGFLHALQQAAQGKPTIYVHEVCGLKGTRRWLESHAVPFPALDGQSMQVLSVTRDISDRKRAELALRHREWLTRFFLEHTPIPAAVFDTEMRYLMVSHRWRTEYQLGDQPLIGRSHYEVFPDLPEHWREIHQRCLAGETDTAEERPLRRADGQLDWLSWTVRPWYAETGAIGGIIIFTEIVTQRKQAEIALRISQQRYASLAVAAPVGIFRTTPDGHCVYVNDRWCQLAGLAADAAMGMGWLTAIHPDDRERVFSAWYTTAHQDLLFREECRFQRPDRSVSWVVVQATTERNSNGDITGYVGTITDITDRKHAETALKESEERLRLALSASQQGLYDHNLRNNCTIVSAEYAQILGYRPEELQETTETWRNRLHPDDRERAFQIYQDYISGHRPHYHVEFRQRTKQNTWKWVLSVGQIVAWDEQGRPLRMIGTYTDISDRKHTEAQLQQQQELLQTIVDNIPIMLTCVDAQGRLSWVNRRWETMMGWTLAEVQQQSAFAPLYPDPIYHQFVLDFVQTADGSWQDFKSRCRDGTILDTAWANVRLSDGLIIGIGQDVTARKRAAAELQESEERLRLTLAATNQGLYDLNLQTGQIIINAEYAQLLGYEPGELHETYTSWRERLHPDEATEIDQIYQDYIAGKRPEYKVEFRQRIKTGQWKWILSVGKIVAWDEQGQPLRMIGTHTDISDRKQAEAERRRAAHLRLELNLLETILDSVLAGYWYEDCRTGQTYWSAGMKQMFGYTEAELPTVPNLWQRLIFPDDIPEVAANFEQHIQTRGQIPYYNEVRYRHKNGSTVWVICAGQVIEWDSAGQPLYMAGCHVDITRLKQVEAQLQKSETHLRLAQRIGNFGSWEFALATGHVTWSEQVFRIFGREPASGPLDLDTIQQCFHPDDRELHRQAVEQAIATASPYELEARIERPDGTLAHLYIKGQPIVDANGTLAQLIGTVLDITERKLAEAQLISTATQLEMANHELEAFSYSVSHDLRAPLRGIDGFSKALVERYANQLDAKGLHYLNRIRSGTQRMGELIDDLLMLSRVTRADMQKMPVNLSDLVHSITNDLMHQTPDRQVEWVIAPNITAIGDPRLLRIALENLLSNAWKFTSNRTQTRIEFGAMVEGEPAQPIYFVKDNGVGFDMAYGDRLFKPFQRLHSEREFPGTGIGLATIARIIQRHGGSVRAEGILDQSATFYFTL